MFVNYLSELIHQLLLLYFTIESINNES